MIDLRGQVALVTGGSRGIGRAAAVLLARAGADIALTYHTRAADAETAAREIERLGRRAYALGGDLGDPGIVDGLMVQVEQELGGLDIFVANAGIWPADEMKLAAMPVDRWQRT